MASSFKQKQLMSSSSIMPCCVSKRSYSLLTFLIVFYSFVHQTCKICVCFTSKAVFVSKIAEGGTAERDGRLHVGDKVLSVSELRRYLIFLYIPSGIFLILLIIITIVIINNIGINITVSDIFVVIVFIFTTETVCMLIFTNITFILTFITFLIMTIMIIIITITVIIIFIITAIISTVIITLICRSKINRETKIPLHCLKSAPVSQRAEKSVFVRS